MNFLFDHNLPPKLARAIDQLLQPDHRAFPIRDKFDPATADVDWLAALGEDGQRWAVVSADLRIRKNKAEREAFRRAGLIGFFLTPALKKAPLFDQAGRIARVFPTVLQQVEIVEPPAFFQIHLQGKLRQL